MEKNKIICGDSLKVLKTLPDESIDCVITSPPYWALRDYGVDGQIGLEKTFQEYINKLLNIFDEVKRVLKKEGTCWVNIGDTFYSVSGGKFENDNLGSKDKNILKGLSQSNQLKSGKELEQKNLCNIPARFSIGMQDRKWILRNEIIWYKPNCMPSSVEDRFTVDFEKVFFFVKSRRYFFEKQYEPQKEISKKRMEAGFNKNQDFNYKKRLTKNYNNKQVSAQVRNNHDVHDAYNPLGRNKRAVWSINPKGFSEAHFATFPEKLVEPMVMAGCPKGGIVLDPFMGAGTTALVAKKLNRNYLGIELNPEYIKIANERLRQEILL